MILVSPLESAATPLAGIDSRVMPNAVAVSLAVALAAGPLYNLSDRTANELLHPDRYVVEVLG